ncbi:MULTISPECIES: ATP-dependent DNA helicase RecG [Psychrobacter]|uniref:ATP-dependent DNA helicase RecG n=1 Tax=Psychrobacter TaxID=497 RepID=UPI0008682F6C|nr:MULTISPECIES: ATP-dependent DNA helicase RecG [Psychrobacter]MBA6245466.1 ATP-dependent DNA helicase RecG [Psychrobacter sp. Urea-trap-18]MBA6284775.1 ATP-dependent DNA helicase RecG [Psychrobacter sp. Urea-trap-16]MBA6318606.1 ATP-dependent DNA helicase RecG [Psychrobacter sp. Urea-trap-20]MBA6333080.1 ATP-dependent DNA helicase RecG [Psychrobacter sp. Urea-trap-19]OEH67688.1 MAG: ATP-dependent DNA helicase RecG [Psychrobacter sp. B29-1]
MPISESHASSNSLDHFRSDMPLSALDMPVSALAGVGVKVAEQLAQLNIKRIFDLLLHLPRDYEDRSRLVSIADIEHGQSALITGHIVHVDTKRSGMTVTVDDDTGTISLRFFKVYRGLVQTMNLGTRLQLFGEVKVSRYGKQIHHPEYQVITDNTVMTDMGLQPIYPTVKGLHQNKLRTLIKLALQTVRSQGLPMTLFTAEDFAVVSDLPLVPFEPSKSTVSEAEYTEDIFSTLARSVPDNVTSNAIGNSVYKPNPSTYQADNDIHNVAASIAQHNVYNLTIFEALVLLHTPPTYTSASQQYKLCTQLSARTHAACQRLIIEELTAHQLSLLYRRQQLHQHKAPKCTINSPLADKLFSALPFDLTGAQKRVMKDITADMATSIPMLRLVQGDVGAGKTLVAAGAAGYALDSGWQVAVMAPTEILAEQHLLNFKQWFEPLGIGVGWLAGKQTAKQRREALEAVAENTVQVVVGTHALFQEQVQFAKLGLVIIDEQHRFGVEQRMALTNKGVANSTPHQLIMTATPIPRTLAMSVYGDMDTSIIDELPPGRTPITTVTIDRNRRDEVIERIAINCEAGRQAYWVCSLVEASSVLDAQAAEATYEDLNERLDIRIGLVHGKMKSADKQAIMQEFKAGNLDLLIATTVIEVGVDVPNASLMVIENAERLGLSQLHQLRGRVGRGSTKSFCVLLYQKPLSETGTERLNVLRDSTDGFVIAQKDLELRGPGELLGKRQTGNVGYYLADLIRDEQLFAIAQRLAKHLIADPARKADVSQLIHRWMPEASRYTSV